MHSVGDRTTVEPGVGTGSGRETTQGPPEVRLALFGKHPGWRDFVAINPTADELLAATYAEVYCRCLSALLSGAWGPDPAAVVPHFHHLLVRLWPGGEVVVGTLLGSADGLNRQQPLMLVGRCPGVCYHRAIPSLLPVLTQTGWSLRPLRDEQEVTGLLKAAASELSVAVQGTPAPAPGHAAEVLRALLTQSPFAGPGEELDRIVYQLVGHEPSALAGPWEVPRGFGERLPVQVRVALTTPEPAQAAEQWLTFARFLCGRGHPLTLFASLGRTWGDLIAGTPTETELAAILRLPEGELTAPPEGLEVPPGLRNSPEPLTQCVPFSLDEAFRARVAQVRQDALAPPPEPIAGTESERSRAKEMTAVALEVGGRVHSALGRMGWGTSALRRVRDALRGDPRLRLAAWLLAGGFMLLLACLLIAWAVGSAGAVDSGRAPMPGWPVPAAAYLQMPAARGGPAGCVRARC